MTTTQIEELRTYLKEQIEFYKNSIEKSTSDSNSFRYAGYKSAYKDILSKLPEQEEDILRELTMRGQFAFPENEQDIKWFEGGTRNQKKFMLKLWKTIGINSEEQHL